jgi:hypothetical protein
MTDILHWLRQRSATHDLGRLVEQLSQLRKVAEKAGTF